MEPDLENHVQLGLYRFSMLFYILKRAGSFSFYAHFSRFQDLVKMAAADRSKKKEREPPRAQRITTRTVSMLIPNRRRSLLETIGYSFAKGEAFFTGKFYDESREITQEDWPLSLSQTRWVSVTYYIQ